MSLATEAEIRALYINAREAMYIWQIHEELDHLQKWMQVHTDNPTADKINKKVQWKHTKAMD